MHRPAGAGRGASRPLHCEMKRVALLGATGSIGRAGARDHRCASGARALRASRSGSRGDEVAPARRERGASGTSRSAAIRRSTSSSTRSEPDVVLNAVVGFAGLPATLAALEAGIDLALANKESLVAAGELALAAQERGGGRILPVDSEHSRGRSSASRAATPETVHSLVLTASGGPFRGRTRDELADVTPEEALAHPTWSMGPKITIDSATLMNKGLELIEAHFLFGLPYERIEVVVHPTSIVHSLVRFRDGAALAHLGYPDMRVPISYALTYPERAPTPIRPLDLAVRADARVLARRTRRPSRACALARAAGEAGGTAPCVLNAANEVAVAAFLAGELPFLGIPEVVERTLATVEAPPARDLAELVAIDAEARARRRAAHARARAR